MLPKDILVKIALQCELSEIINLCLTCKEINRKVCENKFFWINKLYKDYEIDFRKSNLSPRKYYLGLDYIIKFLNASEDGLFKSFTLDEFEKLKAFNDEIVEVFFNTKKKFLKNFSLILNLIEMLIFKNDKIEIFIYIYNNILPKVTYIKDNDFWKSALDKLEEVYNDEFNNNEILLLYMTKKDFYRELAER